MDTRHSLPEPPYYAVIFTSERTDDDDEGYRASANRMLDLARGQPGFLGVDSARDSELGITVSYWRDPASIEAWRIHAEHLAAQRGGRERWYQCYTLRIALVERQHRFNGE